jgi:hypothetical protein
VANRGREALGPHTVEEGGGLHGRGDEDLQPPEEKAGATAGEEDRRSGGVSRTTAL